MKRVTGLFFVAVMGFLPFFSFGHVLTNWEAPTITIVKYWTLFSGRTTGPSASELDTLCQHSSVPLSAGFVFKNSTITIHASGHVGLCIYHNPQYPNAGLSYRYPTWNVETISKCNNALFPLPEDTTGNGVLNHCHANSCEAADYLWASGKHISSASGSICIKQPAGNGAKGKMCKYSAMKNDDGSASKYNFSPTGKTCNCKDEAVPCKQADEGEITNNPQDDNSGCTALGGTVFCEAKKEDHCKAGVCESGCGYIGSKFFCSKTTMTEKEAKPCVANDSRYSCQGVATGGCPKGVANCADPKTTPPAEKKQPPKPCVANDTREQCKGVEVGKPPNNPNEGIESGLATVNRNLTDIKNINEKINDAVNKKVDKPSYDPSDNSSWSSLKQTVDNLTSSTHVPASQTSFQTNIAGKEGFFNNQIAGLFPSGGSCSPYVLVLPSRSWSINLCSTLGIIKQVLEWFIALLSIVYLRNLFLSLKPSGG